MNIKKLSYGLVAVLVGFSATALQAQNESQPMEGEVFEDALHFYQWVTPEYPPMPDIEVNGEWLPWEDVYGPLLLSYPSISERRQSLAARISESNSNSRTMTESLPYTRDFANPSQRSFLLSINQYPPQQIDFYRLKKLSDQHAAQIPSPSTDLALMLLKSADSNGVYRTGIQGSITNGITQNYTVYKLQATNINSLEEIEIFFSEKANFENTLTTVISCVGTGFRSKTYVVTVDGHHSSGFFTASFVSDSDKDGLSDGVEKFIFKSCPTNYNSSFLVDLNGDGSPDYPNKENNSLCDGDEDLDQDGWSNEEEISMGTNPFVADENNLIIPSFWEGAELPNWVKRSLFLYKGAVNAGINTDSDNDGIDNYTELLLKTNPSMFDSIFISGNYTGLPDTQRAFQFPPIAIGRGNLVTTNMFCENFGTKGNYFHIQLLSNTTVQGTNHTTSLGTDTILLNGAYLDPLTPDHNGIQMLTRNGETKQQKQKCCLSTESLLGKRIQILTNAWCQSGVITTNLDHLESEIIAQRSKDRILVSMRKMQLLADPTNSFSQLPPVIQKRVHKHLGELYMETQLYHKACQVYFQNISSPKVAYCLQFEPGICMVANIATGVTLSLDNLSDNYILAVRNRSNSANLVVDGLVSEICNFISSVSNEIPFSNPETVFFDILSDFRKSSF